MKILFVCLGNICRSTAAQGILEHIAEEAGLSHELEVDSAGTYSGHQGQLPDPRMRKHASKRGYDLRHRARAVERSDFARFDLIIAMDENNYNDLLRLAPNDDAKRKLRIMTDYLQDDTIEDIPDPYYMDNDGFELVLDLLEDGCQQLFDQLFP